MTDWNSWSRDAVRMMQERNDGWRSRFRVGNAQYRWSLDLAQIAFRRSADDVVADLCVVGTTSAREGTFLWAWANDSIPSTATAGLDVVREFGVENDLPLLTDPVLPGGRAEALEALAIAGRIQDADGVFIDEDSDGALFFTLHNFRTSPRTGGAA